MLVLAMPILISSLFFEKLKCFFKTDFDAAEKHDKNIEKMKLKINDYERKIKELDEKLATL